MPTIYIKSSVTETRRLLRKRLAKAEKILWQYLKGKNFYEVRFKRQYSVDFYILDFYCPKFRLAIEIDGGYHLDNEVKKYDQERQEYIENSGIRFIRFANEEVLDEIDGVLIKIKKNLKSSPLLE